MTDHGGLSVCEGYLEDAEEQLLSGEKLFGEEKRRVYVKELDNFENLVLPTK